jgi:hypothetical protein
MVPVAVTIATHLTTKDVEKALCEMFHTDRLAAFIPLNEKETEYVFHDLRMFWFRVPGVEGIKVARLDGEGNMHVYKLLHFCVRYADGEVRDSAGRS